jgi:hypothetical protein
MRKYAFVLLFILGGFEVLFAITSALHAYSFEPVFMRTFAVSTFTPEQRQVYYRFISANQSEWSIVALFGAATIVLGIILLVTGRRKDHA